MIQGYVGRPGSGKTYTLTERVLHHLKRDPKLRIFSNYTIHHPNAERITFDDFLMVPPGLIVIDEAHGWFDARHCMKLPPEVLMQLSQTRKAGWDLYWCTQHESRIDKVIRNNSNWIWVCNAWLKGAHKGLDHGHMELEDPTDWRNPDRKEIWIEPDPDREMQHPRFFTAKCYEPELLRKPDKHHVRRIKQFSCETANGYDTFEVLKHADHVYGVNKDVRVREAYGSRAVA